VIVEAVAGTHQDLTLVPTRHATGLLNSDGDNGEAGRCFQGHHGDTAYARKGILEKGHTGQGGAGARLGSLSEGWKATLPLAKGGSRQENALRAQGEAKNGLLRRSIRSLIRCQAGLQSTDKQR
jgi:hypothetical protein